MADWRHALAASALALTTMTSTAASSDFSADLDKLWDYTQPAVSQQRFRAELAKYSPGSREALEIETQIARTESLQRNFAAADKILDEVLPKLGKVPVRVEVRYFLERGRTRNTGGDKPAATALFAEALKLSDRDKLPSADFYRIDALHMLAIAAPNDKQLEWNLKALAAAEASSDARAQGWAASLNNNIGWTYFDRGDAKTALMHWEKALPLREAQGNAMNIRIAKWMIARAYRALARTNEAEKIQLALAEETERANAPDGYIYEELAELAFAKGDQAKAQAWAIKAHALLKDDPDMTNEKVRLARLSNLAQGKTP